MYEEQLQLAILIYKALACVIEGCQKLEAKVEYPLLQGFIINLLLGEVVDEDLVGGLIPEADKLYDIIELLQAENDIVELPETPPDLPEYDI